MHNLRGIDYDTYFTVKYTHKQNFRVISVLTSRN